LGERDGTPRLGRCGSVPNVETRPLPTHLGEDGRGLISLPVKNHHLVTDPESEDIGAVMGVCAIKHRLRPHPVGGGKIESVDRHAVKLSLSKISGESVVRKDKSGTQELMKKPRKANF
jgi:hypothetical protein